jgi:teichuronic acid exporter
MEFGKHIGKGLWAFADKGLPVVYGLGFTLLVVRTFPPLEFGSYVLVQSIFLFAVMLASGLAYQPLIKFAAETDDLPRVFWPSFILFTGFLLAVGLGTFFFRTWIAEILNAPTIDQLLPYVLWLSIPTAAKTVMVLFQSKLKIQNVFWVDAIYFLGSLAGIAYLNTKVSLMTAENIFRVNVSTMTASAFAGILMTPREWIFPFKLQRSELARTWNYGKYSLGSGLAANAYNYIDSFIISSFLGTVAVALYNAAKIFTRVFDVYVQVIQMLIIPVSARLFSQSRHEELRTVIEKSLLFFSLAILPLVMGIFVFAPQILSLFYGIKYSEAVPILRLLALVGIALPWFHVLASLYQGLGRIRESFYLSIGNCFVGVSFLILFAFLFGISGVAIAMVFTIAFSAVSWHMLLTRYIRFELSLLSVFKRFNDLKSFALRVVRPQHFQEE